MDAPKPSPLTEALLARLWTTYNNGRMPGHLRMSYELWGRHMAEPMFYDAVELAVDAESDPTFQGLPVLFDSWYKVEPHIVATEIQSNET